jgi:hypothetical protein
MLESSSNTTHNSNQEQYTPITMVIARSATPITEPLQPEEKKRIRSNYIHKLGIDADQHKPKDRLPSRGSLIGKVNVTSEPLKYKEEREPVTNWNLLNIFQGATVTSSVGSTAGGDTSSCNSSTASKERRLTFYEEVVVVPIPRRDEYSARVKDRLWMGAEEINSNAQRNALEFAAEGWDWRSVTEDDGMYICTVSGERIHPVHCDPTFQEEAH